MHSNWIGYEIGRRESSIYPSCVWPQEDIRIYFAKPPFTSIEQNNNIENETEKKKKLHSMCFLLANAGIVICPLFDLSLFGYFDNKYLN